MPSPGQSHPFHPSATRSHGALLGSTGRLAAAAAVLGSARAVGSADGPRGFERSQAAAPPSPPFESAVQLYEDGRWADAFAAAARLADADDPRAARLVLLMLRHGAPLYGVGFTAEPRRIARWAKTVIRATAALPSATVRGPAVLGSEPNEALAGSAQRDPRSTSRRTASPSSITAIA